MADIKIGIKKRGYSYCRTVKSFHATLKAHIKIEIRIVDTFQPLGSPYQIENGFST
jgi:hypothetical protein